MTASAPAYASAIWAFGETASIEASGNSVVGAANASYTSVNLGGGFFDVAAGINSTLTDPTSNLTYSPNIAPPGLSSVALFLSAENSAMNVSASQASGTTHMFASSLENTTGPSGVETLDSSAIEMEDQLTFSVGGSGSDTITVGFSLDGNVTAGVPATYSQLVEYNFGNPLLFWSAGTAFGPTTSPTTGWNTFSFTGNTATGFNFVGTLTITNGEVVPISFIQQLNCNNGAVCDFQNTGQMSLVLPSDVTYSSASGVFLTQSATTPEPGSLVLMGLGFAAIGCLRRRSRR